MNTQSPLTILACMHELTRSGKSLSTTAVVALFAYAQPFGHAADQLLELPTCYFRPKHVSGGSKVPVLELKPDC